MSPTIPARLARRSPGGRWSAIVRGAAAVVFVVFGAGKFVNHASELASFRHYALPAPEVLVYAVGVLEIAGGVLLASGRMVRLAAVVLAADMVGAIVASGLGQGEIISLTLAPVLLVSMIFLILIGAPRGSGARAERATRSPRAP